jgi:lipid-binding SYLF domain-containing protein
MISNTAERDLGLRTTVFMLLAALATILTAIRPAAAAGEPERLVEKSKITLDELLQDPGFSELSGYIGQAKGVLIFPQLIKGGFIVGGEGGSGVFLVKGADGSWSAPAFYTLAAGSIGLQIGGQVSQVVFTVMNDGAVESILKNQFKLGADASVAVGPIGKGLEASTTTNLKLDIYAFSKAAGAFGGGTFEGAGILRREAWNEEYYGLKVSPRDIVINRKVFNASADPLREALASIKAAQ